MSERKTVWLKSLYTIVFMTGLTALFITVLSALFLKTRPLIEINEAYDVKMAVLRAAGISPESTEASDVISLYDLLVEEKEFPAEKWNYYQVGAEEGLHAFVFPFRGAGLWGEIEGVLGYDASLEHITGMDILKQNETPGLGGRIGEDWFRDQFIGKQGPFTELTQNGGEEEHLYSFQAITGATSTSAAFQSIINGLIEKHVKALRSHLEEER